MLTGNLLPQWFEQLEEAIGRMTKQERWRTFLQAGFRTAQALGQAWAAMTGEATIFLRRSPLAPLQSLVLILMSDFLVLQLDRADRHHILDLCVQSSWWCGRGQTCGWALGRPVLGFPQTFQVLRPGKVRGNGEGKRLGG